MESINYTASPVCAKFHNCDDFVRALIGPFGSGKSVACVIEALLRGMAQVPCDDGIRRTRGVIVRNSYRELIDTTINTWLDWMPPAITTWRWTDMKCTITFNDVHMEVLFRALDKPSDVKKLLSLELTWAWLNEVREIPKAIFDALQGRLGRYPSKKMGGPTWYGLWVDTNPPDEDHWFYKLFEEQRPDGFSIFHQPSGLSPDAENVENLVEGYYERMSIGKDKEWIDVYVHGKYGFVQDGKPIHPRFKKHIHVAKNPLPILPHKPIIIGIDFGLTPAAVLLQQASSGQWQAKHELVTEDMGASEFAKELNRLLGRVAPGVPIEAWGDPAGEQRVQTDKKTPFDILARHKIPAIPTYTNDTTIRIDTVNDLLGSLDMAGEPALLVSPECKYLIRALSGKYRYRRLKVAGDERYEDKPEKNRYSHVAEALQYALLGAGEGYKIISDNTNLSTTVKTALGYQNDR